MILLSSPSRHSCALLTVHILWSKSKKPYKRMPRTITLRWYLAKCPTVTAWYVIHYKQEQSDDLLPE